VRTPHDPFRDPPLSALNVLDLLCDGRGWRLRLCSTGTKTHVHGDPPSVLTELRVVWNTKNRGQVASCPVRPGETVEEAARRTIFALRKAEREAPLQ
jgi:hypothetical protein